MLATELDIKKKGKLYQLKYKNRRIRCFNSDNFVEHENYELINFIRDDLYRCGELKFTKKQRLRFKGVDTWEKRTRDKEEKIRGLAATAFTTEYLEKNNGLFTIQSFGVGKYGRVLAEIFIEGEKKSLNELLLENGHAYVYEGGKKKVFQGWQNQK